MKKNNNILLILFFLTIQKASDSFAIVNNNKDSVTVNNTFNKPRPIYSFTLIDYSDKPFSMKQFNEGYLSLYRFNSNLSYKHIPKKYQYLILPIQCIVTSIYLSPLTHEEGHRSVLTNLNIGSVSAPLFKNGVAKVKGVNNVTLENLRNTQFPDYIRLHTAGIESDYLITRRSEQVLFFNEDRLRNIAGDYYTRKLGIIILIHIWDSVFFRYGKQVSETTFPSCSKSCSTID
jgi:hypothetical protein